MVVQQPPDWYLHPSNLQHLETSTMDAEPKQTVDNKTTVILFGWSAYYPTPLHFWINRCPRVLPPHLGTAMVVCDYTKF